MRLLSFLPPIAFNHSGHHFSQRISFGGRQVGFLVFGESRQNKHWHIYAAEQVDNSRTPALSARTKAETLLANASATGNDDAAGWIRSQAIYDSLALV